MAGVYVYDDSDDSSEDYELLEDPVLKSQRLKDPVLQKMLLEAEAEQDAAYEKSRGPILERAKHVKKYMHARRTLKFGTNDPKSLSALTVSSYETDDFMSEPSMSIHELKGETAWMNAYKAKAKQRKKLRKLIAGSDKSPVKSRSPAKPRLSVKAKSPVKVKMVSPAKIAQAYANQSPAIQQAVAAVLATAKILGNNDIELYSSDGEEVPLPTRFSFAGKKSFFADPATSPTKSPKKKSFFAEPASSPTKSPKKKSFFAEPPRSPMRFGDIILDSSDEDVPLPTKFSFAGKKSFFSEPPSSPIKSPYKQKK